jgi:hypothetical protein
MIKGEFYNPTNKSEGRVAINMLSKRSCFCTKTYSFQEIKTDFETNLEDFELFWY